MRVRRPLLFRVFRTVKVLPNDVTSASMKLLQMTTGPMARARLLTTLSVIRPGPWLPNRIAASSIGSTIVLPSISIVAGLLVLSPVKKAFEPVE